MSQAEKRIGCSLAHIKKREDRWINPEGLDPEHIRCILPFCICNLLVELISYYNFVSLCNSNINNKQSTVWVVPPVTKSRIKFSQRVPQLITYEHIHRYFLFKTDFRKKETMIQGVKQYKGFIKNSL